MHPRCWTDIACGLVEAADARELQAVHGGDTRRLWWKPVAIDGHGERQLVRVQLRLELRLERNQVERNGLPRLAAQHRAAAVGHCAAHRLEQAELWERQALQNGMAQLRGECVPVGGHFEMNTHHF